MPGFLPALGRKENGRGLLCSLVRSTDVGFFDNLGPFADLGLDIAIDPLGRVDVDRHSEIGESLPSIRLADELCHLRVQPPHDFPWSCRRRYQCEPSCRVEAGQRRLRDGGNFECGGGALCAGDGECTSEPAFTLPMTAERFANIKCS